MFSILDQSAKGGGAERAAPDFEALPKLESSSKSPSSIRHFNRVLLYYCRSYCVSAVQARWDRRPETVPPRPAEFRSGPHMCASAVRVLCSWLVNWNQHEIIVGERDDTLVSVRACVRASFPSPSAHKRQRTIRPLINARVSSVQVIHRFCVDFLSGSTVLNMVFIGIQERNYVKTGECCF